MLIPINSFYLAYVKRQMDRRAPAQALIALYLPGRLLNLLAMRYVLQNLERILRGENSLFYPRQHG